MEQKNDFEKPPGESIHPGGSISQRVQIWTPLFSKKLMEGESGDR